MIWLLISLVLLSLGITIFTNRKVQKFENVRVKIDKDKISPLIALSSIIIGTTIMIGYILVSSLGKLGLYLAESLKIWIG
ncbi:MAG: hypothetical protein ISR96_11830 [Nitrospira sp.]|nr:hypothetical protein [bacterium]MBL7050193.1 hypothetical protein [Nitrospira sp.]